MTRWVVLVWLGGGTPARVAANKEVIAERWKVWEPIRTRAEWEKILRGGSGFLAAEALNSPTTTRRQFACRCG